jgi:ribosomal protein L7/L12
MYIKKHVTTVVATDNPNGLLSGTARVGDSVEYVICNLENSDCDPRPDITLTEAQMMALRNAINDALDPNAGLRAKLPDPTDEEVLMAKDQKISAIVKYRARTGAGLKEAKDAIEEAMRKDADTSYLTYRRRQLMPTPESD